MLVIIHYDEIGLKGQNRPYFERILAENINHALPDSIVKRKYGRLVCEVSSDRGKVIAKLSILPGISSFSFAQKAKLDLVDIKQVAVKSLAGREFKTFKVDTQRSNKTFPVKSPEVNSTVGEIIIAKTGKKVSIKSPEATVRIEICEKEAYVYCDRFDGVGGLPVGSSAKVVSLLSGGIDSPVASFMMMKRGCRVVLLHIYNDTLVSTEVKEKILKISRTLAGIQGSTKLYIVPFSKIQAQIIANTLAKYRMIVYRRFMMRIANEIAQIEKAKAIVTGDSIGQVASQTIENIACIHAAAAIPVLSPLVGMNKGEITQLAKKIGTYEGSILPYPDCCSFMIAEHPETKGRIGDIERMERVIEDCEKLIQGAIASSEIINLT